MLLPAIVLWPLGEVDRAISLVERAHERTAGLAHIATHRAIASPAAGRQRFVEDREGAVDVACAELHRARGNMLLRRNSALEGFSPTPEMPEIAEAQALMERLV
jgi:hypothetical protein